MSAEILASLPPLPVIEGVEFRHVHGFPGYAVSDDGRVWTCRVRCRWNKTADSWREMKPRTTKTNKKHHRVYLYRIGTKLDTSFHRLVLEAFRGPCPEGMEGCHKDDNPANNRIGNPKWDTHINNMRQALQNNKYKIGRHHPAAKLTERHVSVIRELAGLGYSHGYIARFFKISRSAVTGIVGRRLWKSTP